MTAFAAQGQRMLGQDLAAGLEEASGDTEERIVSIGVTYVRFADAHPAHFAVMFRPDVIDPDDPEIERFGQPNFDLLFHEVARHGATGWQPERDPLELAVMVWSCIHGLAELWLGGLVDERLQRAGIEGLARQLLELVLRQCGESPPRT